MFAPDCATAGVTGMRIKQARSRSNRFIVSSIG